MSTDLAAQRFSTARIWNEMLLNAIRNDFARPTVHARNLFHTSLAMYDAWAAYDEINETYFLGKTVSGYSCPFSGIPVPPNIADARDEAMSYAAYRLIKHRFKEAPGRDAIYMSIDLIFNAFGHRDEFTSTDYASGNPAALGNYIAEQIIAFGLQDGSNEIDAYKNQLYQSVNPLLSPIEPFFNPKIGFGNPRLNDPNRWQQMKIENRRDQAGNLIPGGTVEFIGAEWGDVVPFALDGEDAKVMERDSQEFVVYHDPGPPCYLDTLNGGALSEEYQWGFSMVVNWDAHTVGDLQTRWDISPRSLGNSVELPQTIPDLRTYYNFEEGGDYSPGHTINPRTGMPYEEQLVPRSDYTRVVAQYWADGPESETPPGHWFTLLNMVSDHEALIKKYKGEGEVMDDLEWDVKAYFALGGAMHDAAVAAWSIKGFYDYIRPISAIRYMADRGQSSDPAKPNYDPAGLPLIPGVIAQIDANSALYRPEIDNLGQVITIFAGGGDQIFYMEGDRWLPYQPVNFVTPPFAGYVSGHSTFSRAAAEVLTKFTGDEFFPGGLAEVAFKRDAYLNVGRGPSQDMTLQWATYRDASNQSSLSRIWGGIHPPVDDIAGRRIGVKVGQDAFALADGLFGDPASVPLTNYDRQDPVLLFPNPAHSSELVRIQGVEDDFKDPEISLIDNLGRVVWKGTAGKRSGQLALDLSHVNPTSGMYTVLINTRQTYLSKLLVI